MEKAKNKATAWIVFSALYATVAAILEEGGFFWAEAFVPMICMICAAACFELGRDYQFEVERDFGELEMNLKKKEFEWKVVEENTYAKVLCCKRCHGTEFRKVADRLICNICGEVLEVENGTGET